MSSTTHNFTRFGLLSDSNRPITCFVWSSAPYLYLTNSLSQTLDWPKPSVRPTDLLGQRHAPAVPTICSNNLCHTSSPSPLLFSFSLSLRTGTISPRLHFRLRQLFCFSKRPEISTDVPGNYQGSLQVWDSRPSCLSASAKVLILIHAVFFHLLTCSRQTDLLLSIATYFSAIRSLITSFQIRRHPLQRLAQFSCPVLVLSLPAHASLQRKIASITPCCSQHLGLVLLFSSTLRKLLDVRQGSPACHTTIALS